MMIKYIKLLFSTLIILSTINVFASTGVNEFQIEIDYSSYRIINDANKMVAIEVPEKNSKSKLGKCGQYPIENSMSTFKGRKIVFLKNYALVDGVKYSYLEKKTDLYPYYGVCL